MSDELRVLLLTVGVSIPVGLLVGVALRKLRPDWCKSYAKACFDRQWKLYLFGVVFFGLAATVSFAEGRPYFGSLSAGLCALEIFCLFRYGFKSIDPELERRIDESDPTQLLPWKFWRE